MAAWQRCVHVRIVLSVLLCFCEWSVAQISYSVSEEVDNGTVVGNLAKDMNLNLQQLQSRNLEINSGYKMQYFQADLKSGFLYVNERIDREELCPNAVTCSLNVEATLSDPRDLRRIEIDILDVNDNSPSFMEDVKSIEMYESSYPGERYPLPTAHDADTGSNSLKTYELSQNEHFSLDVQSSEGGLSAELVLQKSLDREKQAVITLTLTAVDGGKPPRSGTLEIIVDVIDVNDNAPLFSQSLYKAQIVENAEIGATILTLSATDLDDGINSELLYSFAGMGRVDPSDKFSINEETGVITVKSTIDFEEKQAYEIRVQVKDKGSPPRIGHGKVLVEVIDINDNSPEIIVSSLMNQVKEDAELGTVVALVTVTDRE